MIKSFSISIFLLVYYRNQELPLCEVYFIICEASLDNKPASLFVFTLESVRGTAVCRYNHVVCRLFGVG